MFLLTSLDWKIINFFKINVIGFLSDSKNVFIICVLIYIATSILAEKHKKKMKREGREIR